MGRFPLTSFMANNSDLSLCLLTIYTNSCVIHITLGKRAQQAETRPPLGQLWFSAVRLVAARLAVTVLPRDLLTAVLPATRH